MVAHHKFQVRMAALSVQAAFFHHPQEKCEKLFLHHPLDLIPVVGLKAMLHIGAGVQRQQEQTAQPLFRVPLGKRFLDHSVRAALQDPFQQVWNIFKMIVKGLSGDAALIHDVLHRQLFDLLLHQKPLHGLCNQLLCVNCHPGIHLHSI